MSTQIIPFSELPDYAIIRFLPVSEITSLKRTCIYERMKTGEFPKSVPLGKRARGWRVGDIKAYLQNLGSPVSGQ